MLVQLLKGLGMERSLCQLVEKLNAKGSFEASALLQKLLNETSKNDDMNPPLLTQ
jgi:hypothetical protein